MTDHPHLELPWRAIANTVWTVPLEPEPSQRIAVFDSAVVATEVVDDHNMGWEINHPSPEEQQAKRTRDEEIAERVRQWREGDYPWARLPELIQRSAKRLEQLMTIPAPANIIQHELNTLEERVATLRGLLPRPAGEVS